MLTQVKSYRTSDNQLFEDKGAALQHDFIISLRGIFQTETTATSLSTTQAAAILAKNQEKLLGLLRKHKESLGRIARQNKTV